MADAPLALHRTGALGADPSVAFALVPAMTRLTARGGADAAARIGRAFGVDLAQQALRASEMGARAALWLGPDEWLLLAPEDLGLAATVAAGLEGEPGAIVDVSHRNVGIDIAGPGVEAVLNAGCPLDLDPSAFPVGMCTRTVLAKADVVLWRRAQDRFHIECWRSFAPYVLAYLRQAARDAA